MTFFIGLLLLLSVAGGVMVQNEASANLTATVYTDNVHNEHSNDTAKCADSSSSLTEELAEVELLASGKVLKNAIQQEQLPVKNAIVLVSAMGELVSTLKVVKTVKNVTKYRCDQHYGGWCMGQLYGSDGTKKEGLAWEARNDRVEAVIGSSSLVLEELKIVHEDAGILSDSDEFEKGNNNGFWFAVALLKDTSANRNLVVATSRGTMSLSETLADIGLFENDVAKELPWYTRVLWKTLKWATWLPGNLLQSGYVQKEVENALQVNLVDAKEKKSLGQKMKSFFFDKNVVDKYTQKAAKALVTHSEILAKTIANWVKGKKLFGSDIELDKANTHVLVGGHSLGGGVAVLCGLILNSDSELAGKVAGITKNAPQMKGILAKMDAKYQPKTETGTSSFVNLVTQHDIIWKIGDQFETGETTCMYMHPAEDFKCTSGIPPDGNPDTFTHWSKLSDAIDTHCMDKRSRWECTELWEPCWMSEHNIAFHGRNIFEDPVDRRPWSRADLYEQTGITVPLLESGNPVPDNSATQQLEDEIAKLDKWREDNMAEAAKPCVKDLTKLHCCRYTPDNKTCASKSHSALHLSWMYQTRAKATEGDRTPCNTLPSPGSKCSKNKPRRCMCEAHYCYDYASRQCVYREYSSEDEVDLEYEKKKREAVREYGGMNRVFKIDEGKHRVFKIDEKQNHKWRCANKLKTDG